MPKYMPVFFFSSLFIVYIILNAVLKQYQIADCRFFLLSLASVSVLREKFPDLTLLHGQGPILGLCHLERLQK